MKPFLFLFFAIFTVSMGCLESAERQLHGLQFENWVRDTFFPGGTPESYTAKWDIPKEANKEHGGVPVNPKATQYNYSVDLGDALRQFDIDEPFLLIIGYWQPAFKKRRWVKAVAIHVEPNQWRELWGEITRADLEKLDAAIKDRSLTPKEAREKAQEIKNQSPFKEAAMTVNPKIDEKGQRRLQCSLTFTRVFEYLASETDPAVEEEPALFGIPLPQPE